MHHDMCVLQMSYVTWDGMEWDEEFQCVFVEVYQIKVCKMKLICFVAGIDRFCCWFLAFGDYLSIRPQQSERLQDPDAAAWLIPELHSTGSATTKMGRFIKAVQPDATAGGVRPGLHAFC